MPGLQGSRESEPGAEPDRLEHRRHLAGPGKGGHHDVVELPVKGFPGAREGTAKPAFVDERAVAVQ